MRKLEDINREIIFICIFILLLSACNSISQQMKIKEGTVTPSITNITLSPTLAPSMTLTPTKTPTDIGTPVPTLMAHEWVPVDPLITFDGTGGDGGCAFAGTLPISFTLLSDGELFMIDWNNDAGAYEIKGIKLSRQETCNLLNAIDQAGFFDYDPSTYISDPVNWRRPVMGAGRTEISVQAWRSNSIDLYGLWLFITRAEEVKESWNPELYPDIEFPTILSSLRKTFQILVDYEPSNMGIYQSDRVGLWVTSFSENSHAVEWPVNSVNLSQVVSPEGYSGIEPDIILSGEEALTIYQFFDQKIDTCGIYVSEGDNKYLVYARPLLPNEFLAETAKSSDVISCSPEDGWVEIP